jgi:hypothetical protein
MFLKKLRSSDGEDEGVGEGEGDAVCARALIPENSKAKKIMLKWQSDILLLRMVLLLKTWVLVRFENFLIHAGAPHWLCHFDARQVYDLPLSPLSF